MTSVLWSDGRVVVTDGPGRSARVDAGEVEELAIALAHPHAGDDAAVAAAVAYGMALAALRSAATCAQGLLADVETAHRQLFWAAARAPGASEVLVRMMAFARQRVASGSEGFPEAMLAEAHRLAARALARVER